MSKQKIETTASPETVEPQRMDPLRRKPKRALLFKGRDWVPLTSVSEKLIRSIPGADGAFYLTPKDGDIPALSRAVVSFSQRVRATSPEFAVTTTTCMLIRPEWTEENGKRVQKDILEKVLRVEVVCNPMFDAWIDDFKEGEQELGADDLREQIINVPPHPLALVVARVKQQPLISRQSEAVAAEKDDRGPRQPDLAKTP